MLQEVKTGSQLVSVHRCEVEKAAPENEKKISKYFFFTKFRNWKGTHASPFFLFCTINMHVKSGLNFMSPVFIGLVSTILMVHVKDVMLFLIKPQTRGP